jgi:GntR family transcriptional regulator / MocR family aminotransferase
VEISNCHNFSESKLNQIVLHPRTPGVTLTRWLYDEIRDAILSGRLRRGSKLPSSREFAARQGVSRHIVVNVFDQLVAEGYLYGRVGSGTRVCDQIPEDFLAKRYSKAVSRGAPNKANALPQGYDRPSRPFRLTEPALDQFPLTTWNRIARRVSRLTTMQSLAGGEWAGSTSLRAAVAAYLGASRGVACTAENVVIVSGTQQSLDLLARLVTVPGDAVWLEDPCYIGAVDAFRLAAAVIIPVRVDENGLDPVHGRSQCPAPKAIYLTPAHQFGLGTTLSHDRRLDLLSLASNHGAVLIEDDYDSEFCFSGRPLPTLKGLDGGQSVFLLGSFNKTLFPALRLGYMVVPDAWLDRVLALRYRTDRYPPALSQEITAAFIEDGHFDRHLRRMRGVYGARRDALESFVEQYLKGALKLPEIQAGLNTPAYLLMNGVSARSATEVAAQRGIEVWPIDRYTIRRRDLRAIMLGFAAFNEDQIRTGIQSLAKALRA